jgi:hypothetical protein
MSSDFPYFEIPIKQGGDQSWTLNYYGGGAFRAPIEQIDPGYPTRIMVTGHGLPSVSNTPVIISGVEGMTALNSKDTGIVMVTRVDDDSFDVPISTVAKEWCVGTGEITYYQPADLSAYTIARCQIRKRWHSAAFDLELTLVNGGITINLDDASLTFNLTSAQTSALTADRYVWDCELETAAGSVLPFAEGKLLLGREVTR